MYSKWIARSFYMGLALLVIGILLYLAAISNIVPNGSLNSNILLFSGIILMVIAALQLPFSIGWFVLVKLAEVLVNKSTNKNPNAAGIIYVIGVPVLAMVLCVVVAYAYSFYTYSMSMSKYGANFNTISDSFAYPTHQTSTTSGQYTVTVTQNEVQKKTKAFSFSITNNNSANMYEDAFSYTTDFSSEGEIHWSIDNLLLVSAKEGDFVYYPAENEWIRINRNPKTDLECTQSKAVLVQFKSMILDGSSLITCPTSN